MSGHRHPRAWRPSGFTLVELLTVIAILAVLGTLLLTALTSAQKKSRQARCTANLHQLSLALNMYLDDFDQRARRIQLLAQTKYLPNRQSLICPQDKTANWGGLVNEPRSFGDSFTIEIGMGPGRGTAPEPPAEEPIHYSYLHPLPWDDQEWNRLMKAGSLAGVAACQVHGLGKPHLSTPSIYDFEGLVLRAQRDGAVVQRKVFWRGGLGETDLGTLTTLAGPTVVPAGLLPWPLFVDDQPH
jgi:prepilin-type N-terminal cleavage/methylation domain-containing protein